MQSGKAKEIRVRYKYRRLILSGQTGLPQNTAAKLIGPDCVYHLYSRTSPTNKGQNG
jgi:hypothetical protein